MLHPHRNKRTPLDLTDEEVHAIRRLSFTIALEILAMKGEKERSKRGARMALIEKRLVNHPANLDGAAQLYAVGQVAQFVSNDDYFDMYVPPNPLEDEEWLRFMVESRGRSDSAIAFQIARSLREFTDPPIVEIRASREEFGIEGADSIGENKDTLRIIAAKDGEVIASDFLTDKAWLERRVVDEDMSDGMIARELEGVGAPCDRSTVRGYRSKFNLTRPSIAQEREDEAD